MLTIAPPPTETLIYEVEDDTGGDGFCHILDDDGGRLCRSEPADQPTSQPGGIHVTRRPADPTCDGCGRPRCPKCRDQYQLRREEA